MKVAMITCPECGRKISEYAPACVGCGVPMEMIKKLLAESDQNSVSADSENSEETAQVLTTHLDKKTEDQKKTREIRCIICGTNYDITDQYCPNCKYPAFSLASNVDKKAMVRLAKLNKEPDLTDAEAKFQRGLSYDYGKGVILSKAKAADWYLKAAEQGHADAQNNLGHLYEIGAGVEKNYQKAAEWYLKAAEQGQADAQNNLGDLYKRGVGVKQNFTEATEWYRKAANQGNAKAQYNLGVSYEKGLGVEKNQEKAAEWYRKAADQGYASAANKIARRDLMKKFFG